MDTIFEFRKGILFVRIHGVITKETYLKYNEEIISMIKDNGINNVVINLNNVYKIDLKGINSILYTYEVVKKNKGTFMISNVNKHIESILVKSHIYKYINILKEEIDSFKKIAI